MSEEDLLAYLEEEASQAYHHLEGDLASDRLRAYKEYLREPYGNEEEGHSQVVTSDVFDAVEGMLPDLIEVFTASDKAVVFEPVGAEDEESAEQVTNACNYVFYKQNNGFMTLYAALKDGLLLKTGGIKWYWENKRTPTFTSYRNVDEMQLAVFLTTNPKAEVVEKEEVELSAEELAAQEAGAVIPKRYNVKIKTIEEKGAVRIAAIPPDELQVSRRHNSVLLDDCPYVAHVVEKTLSDIRQMGYDVTAEDVKAAQDEATTADKSYRDTRRGGLFGRYEDDNELDESMVRGWLRDEYVLVDFDGDGIAERRRVVRLGQKVLENKECSHVPMAAWTPYILTHRFDGISVADLVSDFQKIHTDVLRQQLDNLYLANNQESVVLTDGQGNPLANIDDLLNRRPGGIIREKAPNAVRPYQQRWQGIEAMPMLEQLQVSKENRTGYTRYSQGLDANSLNKTATGVQMIMNASQKRMKLMARIAAEALVAPTFRGIFKTLTDYGMEKLAFRLNGKFVQYDPQEWRDQYDMTINVGIGTGDAQQQSAFLMQLAQSQAVIAQSPFAQQLISAKNIYNLQAKLAENAGFKNPQEFFQNPDEVPPPQPKPDAEELNRQHEMRMEQMKQAHEIQLEQLKSANQHKLKTAEITNKVDLARMATKPEIEAQAMLKAEEFKGEVLGTAQLMAQQLAGELSQVIQGHQQEVAAVTTQLIQEVQNVAELQMAPRQIVRGKDGKPIGVSVGGQVRPIVRGADGKIQGVQ